MNVMTVTRIPVSELRTCQPHTDHSADKLARCMHWRDYAGVWRCETLFPYTLCVEPQEELAPADPPSEQAQQETPASAESRDVAHAEAGAGPSIFARSVERFGESAQLEKAIEECAELIVAIKHYRAGKATAADVASEVAGVLITAEQLRFIFAAEVAQAMPVQLAKLDAAIILARGTVPVDDVKEADRWARRNRELERRLSRIREWSR